MNPAFIVYSPPNSPYCHVRRSKKKVSTKTRLITIVFAKRNRFLTSLDCFSLKRTQTWLIWTVFAKMDPNLTDSDCFSRKWTKPDLKIWTVFRENELNLPDCFSRKWTQTCLKWTVFRENGSKLDWFGLFSRKWIQTWLIWTVSRENSQIEFGLFSRICPFPKILLLTQTIIRQNSRIGSNQCGCFGYYIGMKRFAYL